MRAKQCWQVHTNFLRLVFAYCKWGIHAMPLALFQVDQQTFPIAQIKGPSLNVLIVATRGTLLFFVTVLQISFCPPVCIAKIPINGESLYDDVLLPFSLGDGTVSI